MNSKSRCFELKYIKFKTKHHCLNSKVLEGANFRFLTLYNLWMGRYPKCEDWKAANVKKHFQFRNSGKNMWFSTPQSYWSLAGSETYEIQPW